YFHPNSDASPNISGFCDHSVQAQIDQALKVGETDPSAANAMWAQIDRRVTDLGPIVTLFNPKLVDFVSKRVRGYEYNPQAGFLRAARDRLIRLVELGMPSDPADEPESQWLLWLDVWARSLRNATVDDHRRDLEGRWIGAYAGIVEHGLATGEFRAGVDPHDFAVRLAALIDGLGKSLILRDPWMRRERMPAACTAMGSNEPAAGQTARTS